ncbi:MAG: HAD hydrolase-like protein, partial [Lachnospiraceae bacterium]|nr:HAD hydrolase-like protein [Lachnospiraceae bacterium]
SNNREERVQPFAEAVGATGYVFKANKPAKQAYLRGMKRMGTNLRNTLFIGDQIFTDVWGAKRTGIHGILVEPVQKWHEEPQIILKRFAEALVLKSYLSSKISS